MKKAIELPCDIGDTIYYIEPTYGILGKDKVQMIGITSRGFRIKCRNYHPHNKDFAFGKTVFLTQEEAEKALNIN